MFAVVARSFPEPGDSPLYGEDGIRRRHPRVRDGLIGVNDPVLPAVI